TMPARPGSGCLPRPAHHTDCEVHMLEQMTDRLDFHAKSLMLRSQRQQVIASNIANADTPGYVARDFDFAAALKSAGGSAAGPAATTDARRFSSVGAQVGGGPKLGYAVQTQPAQDRNTVDLDRERAAFADNTIRYESTL